MPNLEPIVYRYGSRQKRIENFNALVEFLEKWKANEAEKPQEECGVDAVIIAERFCNLNFQYGYVSRNDIVEQALMKTGLI